MNYNPGLDIQKRVRYLVQDLSPILFGGLTLWWDPAPALSLMTGLALGLLTIACISERVQPYPTR